MKFVATFKLGYEIKFQEKLEVVGWQVPEASPSFTDVCNSAFNVICIVGASKYLNPPAGASNSPCMFY